MLNLRGWRRNCIEAIGQTDDPALPVSMQDWVQARVKAGVLDGEVSFFHGYQLSRESPFLAEKEKIRHGS